jgi:hypothetical protein
MTLIGPSKRSSALHRNDHAELVILPNTPRYGPAEPCDGLGATFFLACRVADGPMHEEAPDPTQQVPRADPVAPALSAGDSPGRPQQNPGNSLYAPGSDPWQPQESPGIPVQAPNTDPGQSQRQYGNPLQSPKGNPGAALPAPDREASPANVPVASKAGRHRRKKRKAIDGPRRVSWMRRGVPVGHQHASQAVMDQGIVTTMKLAAALRLPCCCMHIGHTWPEHHCSGDGVHIRACQNRRFCGPHCWIP